MLGLLAYGCGGKASGDPPTLYAEYCARCHGVSGRGDPRNVQLNPNLDLVKSPAMTAGHREQVANRIAQGYGPMPGFGRKLDSKDIEALVDYCFKLHRQEP